MGKRLYKEGGRQDRSREQGFERACGADRLVWIARVWPGADRAGGGAAVAMALCGDEASGSCDRAVGDPPCAQGVGDDAVKTDRNDARGIAQLMRLGWFKSVHCKSLPAQEVRALLTARKLVQSKLHDVEMSLRGILRGFGLKVGPTTPKRFAGRIQELVTGHPSLQVIADALLAVHAVLLREFNGFEQRVRIMAGADAKAELLMTTPAVGPIVALTYACAIDDPARFKSSKQAGAHFGLTPRKYQSGETDYTGRISKIGDAAVREALYQAAHVMLTKPVKGCADLKSWAMRIARRAGMRKAKVALARKLAVILHRMLADGKPFNPTVRRLPVAAAA